jgi:hypothetical protein
VFTILFRHHLEKEERLVAVIHKHWLMFLIALLPPGVVLLLIGAILFWAPFRPLIILGTVASFSVVLWLLRCFLSEFLDAWIVTDQSVIAVIWEGFLHRRSTRIILSDIQGVTYEVEGVLGTIFRYGTLAIEKISTGTAVSLPHVAKPRTAVAVILRQQEAYLHEKNLKHSRMVQELLAEIVAENVQLRDIEAARKG